MADVEREAAPRDSGWGWRDLTIVGLGLLALAPFLGAASRLSYHEAHVAQAARELLAHGDWIIPTLDGRPWLEKPPLAQWLVALAGRLTGRVDAWVARGPSVAAALAIALAVGNLGARRFGREVGILAGLAQATMVWGVSRGRLAEADIALAALVAWAMVAFDRVRDGDRSAWRWLFFGLLGATSLAKGIGFGAALVGAAVALVLAWDRDRDTLVRLVFLPGWALATLVALTWPVLVLARHPQAGGLWVEHIAGRFTSGSGGFAGEPWWEYASAPLVMLLPWTPLALGGAWRSAWRAVREPRGPDRWLWAWAVGPAVLVSLARARNAHYLLSALPPWSIWTALALTRLGERLAARGWPAVRRRRLAGFGFLALGLAYAVGYGWLGPRFDRRGREWAFFERAGRLVRPGEPLVLLYDDWDRRPYPTPFGPMPHDLAVRLFHLERPATWRTSPEALLADPPPDATPFAVIGRERDLPALRPLGRVERIARGPRLRGRASRVDDRTFLLFRVVPRADAAPDRLARAAP